MLENISLKARVFDYRKGKQISFGRIQGKKDTKNRIGKYKTIK